MEVLLTITHHVIPIQWHAGGTTQREASEAVSALLAAGAVCLGSCCTIDGMASLWALPVAATPPDLVKLDEALLEEGL